MANRIYRRAPCSTVCPRWGGVLLAVLIAAFSIPSDAKSQVIVEAAGDRCLIIVVDGLRPDYITHDVMPALARFRDEGGFGENHHSVPPTLTRVNASSIVTGSYPRTHGMMGNQIYLPTVRRDRVVNTGNIDELRHMEEVLGGALLTVPTLGEILYAHGKVLFAASSGSTGSGFLLNHRVPAGALIHTEYVLPDSLEPLVNELLGPMPPLTRPSIRPVQRAIDALLEIGIDHLDAEALIVWITEPDGTAHRNGVGAPSTMEVLRTVDREIARLLAGLASRDLLGTTNILVASDHGFSTRTGRESMTALLVESGLKATLTSADIVLAGGAISVNDGGRDRVAAIVRLLQETPWVGPVFTRAAADSRTKGWVAGTLSLGSVMWNHDRSANILAMGDWTASTNEFGFAGEVLEPGVASHGTMSPYDIRATLIVSGPDFKQRVRSTVPTGNADLAPTMLSLLGVPVPEHMDGRVLWETLSQGPDPSNVQVTRLQHVAETELESGRYRLLLHKSFVDGTEYVDFVEVTRGQR